jgi:undecaprenyl phosphate N,N'-diacetylbacillosamine 1-phosphate transferase
VAFSHEVYRIFTKRVMDVVLSLIALTLLSPIILITALVLLYQNKGKVFFFQERPGLNALTFHIIKFKSMTDEKDAEGKLLPDIQRITPFGGMVRKLSIDELPQLFNVLKGDMSLVGPRPLLYKYVPLYNSRQLRRLEVKPGITGWAQVNGRNSIPWVEKFEKDVYYVENISLLLDIKILWLTVMKVLKRDGINQSEDRPMEPFTGDN